MNLDQFIAEEKQRIAEFEAWWRHWAKKTPDRFPSEMGAGEWDEALMTFDPGRDKIE